MQELPRLLPQNKYKINGSIGATIEGRIVRYRDRREFFEIAEDTTRVQLVPRATGATVGVLHKIAKSPSRDDLRAETGGTKDPPTGTSTTLSYLTPTL